MPIASAPSTPLERGASPGRRPLRVLTLIDQIGSGGAERLAVEFATRLDRSRFEPLLCVTRWPEAPSETMRIARDRLERDGVEVLLLSRGNTYDLRDWAPLVRLLRREPVDVIHAHMFGSNVWGTVLGRLARVPVIVAHEHMWSFSGQRLRRWVDRHVVGRGSDAFVAVSQDARRRMIEEEGLPADHVLFIPNGIATPVLKGTEVRAELGIGPDTPVAGAVAVLRPEKGIDVLIRAAEILAKEVPGVQVVVAGGGRQEPVLRALIEELGVQDTMRMLGPREDVHDVFAALDVAVMPSDFEGGPLALMEAMAAGRPVVASRVGGIPELVEDGVHGLLVPPRDPEALAAAIATLLRDPELRRAMGARGQERRQAEFAIEHTVEQLEALYTEIHERSRRGARR